MDKFSGSTSPRRRSLRRWRNGAFAVLLALSLVLGLANALTTIDLVQASRVSAERLQRELSAVTELRDALTAEHGLAHKLIDFGGTSAGAFRAADAHAGAVFDMAAGTYTAATDRALIAQIRHGWNETLDFLRPLATDTVTPAAIHARLGDPVPVHTRLADQMEALNIPLGQLKARTLQQVQGQLQSGKRAERDQVILLGAALLVSFGATIYLARRLRRDVLRPIRKLQDAASRFGAGHLEVRIDLDCDDEFGELASTFNAMADALAVNQRHLRAQAQRIRSVLDGAPTAFVSTDETGRVTEWNRHAEELFGWSHREALGREMAELIIPPLHRPAHRDRLRRLLNGEEGPAIGSAFEFTAVTKHGRELPVERTAWYLDEDGRRSSHAFLRDITERKQAGELQARLAAIVEFSDEAIVGLSPELVVTSWNPGAERLYGYAASEVIGRRIGFLLPPGTDLGDSVLHRVALGERISGYDARVKTKSGSVISISLTASPILDADGAVIGISSIAHDTTERRRLEAELRYAQRLESVGQLAAGITHEINTPIQFVGDNVRFLREAFAGLNRVVGAYRRENDSVERATPSEARRLDAATDVDYLAEEIPVAIEQTLEGVERIATLVRAMKAFGHPSSDGKAPADLNQAVRNTLVVATNEYKYVAEATTELAELPPVWCHLSDINQVLLNLVVNGAHAIQEAVGDSGQQGRITVRTSQDGEDALIEVTDSGAGIPAEIIDRIFDPFFTTKDVGVGSGQGLALAYSLIHDRHRGAISVQSRPGRTTFTIRLPIADPDRRLSDDTSRDQPVLTVERETSR